jgi:putative heme transporter
VLLLLSLRSVGLHAPLTVVIMAAAIERLGTLIPLTPGGTGVAEIGTIAWLVTTGLDPVQVVAGVLLYRVFLVVMEIPVGGLLLGGWAWLQRSSPVRAPAEVGA